MDTSAQDAPRGTGVTPLVPTARQAGPAARDVIHETILENLDCGLCGGVVEYACPQQRILNEFFNANPVPTAHCARGRATRQM